MFTLFLLLSFLNVTIVSNMLQKPYNQIVLFGDSLFQGASDVQDGFSFQAAVQHREWQSMTPLILADD